VVHSATKYLAGHGTTLGGVIVESGKFPWDNGKFPGMTEPSPGYHGVKFYETFGDFGFTMRCRMECLRVYGASLSPMSAWQILQGVETLPCAWKDTAAMPWQSPNSCKMIRVLLGSITQACQITLNMNWSTNKCVARQAYWLLVSMVV